MIAIQDLVQMLPVDHAITLQFVCEHLHRIASYSEQNKMSNRNLSIIFGPTLLRPPPHLDSLQRVMQDMPFQCSVVEVLISYADWVFGPIEYEEDAVVINEDAPADVQEPVFETTPDVNYQAVRDRSSGLEPQTDLSPVSAAGTFDSGSTHRKGSNSARSTTGSHAGDTDISTPIPDPSLEMDQLLGWSFSRIDGASGQGANAVAGDLRIFTPAVASIAEFRDFEFDDSRKAKMDRRRGQFIMMNDTESTLSRVSISSIASSLKAPPPPPPPPPPRGTSERTGGSIMSQPIVSPTLSLSGFSARSAAEKPESLRSKARSENDPPRLSLNFDRSEPLSFLED
jgi:hypothetical protein